MLYRGGMPAFLSARWEHLILASYPVPHELLGERLEACFTSTTVEIFQRGRRVASHARSYEQGRFTTCTEHIRPLGMYKRPKSSTSKRAA